MGADANFQVSVKPSLVSDIASEIPKAPMTFSAEEKKTWKYVTEALFEYGLIHRTDGLTIAVICKTFSAWAKAEQELAKVVDKNNGSYMVTTPNGYVQPHQIFYLAGKLKKELLDWLPEAALTIPSFQKIVGEPAAPNQGSLFDDPVEKHRKNLTKIGMVALNGGKTS